jgi:tRNA-(ms[2]io[6]A)-hydroxylase
MLHLKLPTDPRWASVAELSLEFILVDHAWCEQKAATSCISLIIQFSDKEDLVRQVSPMVTEEWGHFRAVLLEMEKRGIPLGRPRKDEYVNQLLAFQMKGASQEQKLLDQLLTCALIEARSCERFRVLSLGMTDPYMQEFYHRFMASEAGHYTLFMNLAEHYLPKERVRKRWEEFLQKEKEILSTFEAHPHRIH